jgi:hypothetical protein
MSNASLPRSPGYRPSGKCDWLKLLTIAVPFSLLAACALSVVLMEVFVGGFYFFLIVPALAGLILGGAAAALFRYAHCRNPAMAAILGGLLASIMFLGYFHAHFVRMAGLRALTRVDFLPRFINARMHHDVIRDVHDVGNRMGRQAPAPVMNWLWFAGDWLFAAGVCGGVVFAATRRAYCESCMRWMVRKKATAPAGKAAVVVAAVAAKQVASLPEWPATQVKNGTVASQFELEYCPGQADQADVCPIYLTAREVVKGQKKNVLVARQVQLTVEDLAELANKLSFK